MFSLVKKNVVILALIPITQAKDCFLAKRSKIWYKKSNY